MALVSFYRGQKVALFCPQKDHNQIARVSIKTISLFSPNGAVICGIGDNLDSRSKFQFPSWVKFFCPIVAYGSFFIELVLFLLTVTVLMIMLTGQIIMPLIFAAGLTLVFWLVHKSSQKWNQIVLKTVPHQQCWLFAGFEQ